MLRIKLLSSKRNLTIYSLIITKWMLEESSQFNVTKISPKKYVDTFSFQTTMKTL